MAMMKPGWESVMPNSDSTNRTSVRMADRYTMSITGFFACSRGASFTKESRTARFAKWVISLFLIVAVDISFFARLP